MNKKLIESTAITILGASVILALSGQTNLAIAGIGIYLTSLHLIKGN